MNNISELESNLNNIIEINGKMYSKKRITVEENNKKFQNRKPKNLPATLMRIPEHGNRHLTKMAIPEHGQQWIRENNKPPNLLQDEPYIYVYTEEKPDNRCLMC